MLMEKEKNETQNWQGLKNVIDYINNQENIEPSLPIKLAPPSKILESIEKWRQYDFKNKAIEEILIEIENFLDSIGIFVTSTKPIIHPCRLWRIRRWQNELLKDEKEFWAPEDSKISRCNIDGETMVHPTKAYFVS